MRATGPKVQLADAQHEIWAHWMRYLFSVCYEEEDGSMVIPAEKVQRWQRQMNTPFNQLNEKEQASDFDQVEKLGIPFEGVWAVFGAAADDGYYNKDVAEWLVSNGIKADY